MISCRSLLFVPGNNARFIEKARTLDADIICLDLEDSVPDAEKDSARRLVKNLDGSFRGSVYLRTNSPASGLIGEDLGSVGSVVEGLVIPKVNEASEVDEVAASLGGMEVIASIESARGAVNAYGICRARHTAGVVFGVFDLLHDMGIEYTSGAPGAALARAQVPLAAAAAGVPAIDAIWQNIRDVDGLAEDCRAGRDLGYAGKSVIHPDQIGIVHGAFAATKKQLEWARRVRDEYESAAGRGVGAVSLDGRMIDRVHYDRAVALLNR